MSTVKRNGWTFDDDFDTFERELEKGANRITDKAARGWRDAAKRTAPVDTSALKRSGHVRSELRDDQDDAIDDVKSTNPHAPLDEDFIGTREDWGEEDVSVAQVIFLVAYASLINDGFYSVRANRHIAGRPFFDRALRSVKDEFEADQAALLKQLGARVAK